MPLRDTLEFDFFRVERKLVKRGDGTRQRFSLLHCPDWVNVIAFTSDGRLALVRQLRHGIGEYTIEFPGGIADSGIEPLECAKSELLEEMGLISPAWHYLGSFRPNAALQDNWCYTYICNLAEPSRVNPEEGCQPLLTDATTFVTNYKRQLLRQALMATAIMLAQEAELSNDLRGLCDSFFG